MALKNDIKEMLRESFPEMLFAAKVCIDFRKTDSIWQPNDKGGCLGYPAAVTLFCIVDAIGFYNKDRLEILINNKKDKILQSDQHFKILNSKYFNLNLSGDLINAIYEYRCHLVHNLAMPGQYLLNIGNNSDEIFDFRNREKGGRFPIINLFPFYLATEKAVDMFLEDLDSIPYETDSIRKIAAKDVKLKASGNNPHLFYSSGICNFQSYDVSGSTSTSYIIKESDIKKSEE